MVMSKTLRPGAKCLVMDPELVCKIGKSAALLLQQIHYWLANDKIQGKTFQNKKWIANSYQDWATDLKIVSKSTVNRSIKTLKDIGILSIEKLCEYKNNRTNWYTINYDRIAEILDIAENNTGSKEITTHYDQTITKEIDGESFKMSSCKTQNESMYIDKNTNKENIIYSNKSKITQKNIYDDQKKETRLTQQMIDIWNEIVNPEVEAKLTRERCKQLLAALKLKFENNLEKWKEYCLKIVSSDFLMGKIRDGFKIALDAALKFSFIQKIFEKQFGVKDVSLPTETKESVIESIKNSRETSEIKNIRYQICERVGEACYVSWFKTVDIKLSDESIKIIAPTRFMRDYLENNYKTQLERLTRKDINFQSEQVGLPNV